MHTIVLALGWPFVIDVDVENLSDFVVTEKNKIESWSFLINHFDENIQCNLSALNNCSTL